MIDRSWKSQSRNTFLQFMVRESGLWIVDARFYDLKSIMQLYGQ